jgi:hypothetical protein
MTVLTGTRGEFARLTAGADAIEIKATIPHRQIAHALKRYGLTRSNDEPRLIYFLDTPDLALLQAGIIVRARRVVGSEHDSTIKFRPVQPERVRRSWHDYPGFKIEVDASETGFVKSASFSMPVRKGLIKRVVAGRKNSRSLFSKAQEKFLDEMAGTRIDFSKVKVMGPLKAQRWDFRDPACPWPITAELWERGDGKRMMEMSVKAKSIQAAAVMAGFLAFLSEVGAERDTTQLAKTRWALDYYSPSAVAPREGRRARTTVLARRPARARSRRAAATRAAGVGPVRAHRPSPQDVP